jgi:hypothetical protein
MGGATGENFMSEQLPKQVAQGYRASSERGEGHFKLVVVIVIIALIGYSGFKIVPPYVNNYQLQDTCDTESRFFAAHQKTDVKAKETVWAEVQSLGIPITQDAIKVETIGKTARVSVDYTVTVNLFGFDYTIDFHPRGESPMM